MKFLDLIDYEIGDKKLSHTMNMQRLPDFEARLKYKLRRLCDTLFAPHLTEYAAKCVQV